MKQDLIKLLDCKIIYPIKNSSQISNLVLVRKKSGEIMLIVDFRNLNQVSLKDNYPLPLMEQILHTVSGACYFSMIDGYFNQIWVKDEDQFKIAFTTKWGTYAFQRMPFGISNVGATFQRAMDHTFGDIINKIILVYLNDITMFSKSREDHLHHLMQVFEKCIELRISINPKKSIFYG